MKALILIFVLYSTAVFSNVVIDDPNDLLTTVDNYIRPISFDSAYTLGDKAWYKNKECTFNRDENGNYSAECGPVIDTLEEVLEKNSLMVNVGGKIITKDQYENINGNYLRYYLLDSFTNSEVNSVEAKIERINFETFTAQEKLIQAIRIFYTLNICKIFENENICFVLPQEMLLGRNLPAVAQLLEHVYIRTLPTKIPTSKLHDFQRSNFIN